MAPARGAAMADDIAGEWNPTAMGPQAALTAADWARYVVAPSLTRHDGWSPRWIVTDWDTILPSLTV